jgi:hypothetical protein
MEKCRIVPKENPFLPPKAPAPKIYPFSGAESPLF